MLLHPTFVGIGEEGGVEVGREGKQGMMMMMMMRVLDIVHGVVHSSTLCFAFLCSCCAVTCVYMIVNGLLVDNNHSVPYSHTTLEKMSVCVR